MHDGLIADIGRRAPALLCMMDARGDVEYVNERWIELLGADGPALLGSGWMSFVHPEDVDSLVRSFGVALASGEPYRGEFRMRHADGAFRWIVLRAEPERDDRGVVVRWFGAGNDIDAHRRAMDAFERERLVARSFQHAALPAALPDVSACTFSAIYEAGRAEALIGGDWYDAFALADGRIVLSIGDVAGSGLQAAVTMANMRQAIRGVAYVHPDPMLMLEAADLALRSESPDRFVTAFVAVIDPVEDTISFTTAGHPPPLLRTPAGEIVALEASGLPLGLREHAGSASVSRTIETGSMLVLYTDGLIESTHDIDEGYRRLYGALNDPAVLANGDLAAGIRDSVLIDGSRDDVAILCARYAGVALERYRVDVRVAEESARFAAHLVAELERCGYAGDAVVGAEIVLAELVGNLVRHAPGPATFVIDAQRGHVVLHALDDGPGYRFLSSLPTDTFSERGRGLFLISALAEAFHVTLRPFGGSHACVTFSAVSAGDAQRTRWSQTSAHPHPAG
jgi:PAS domain S-box-containing protein